MNNRFTLLRYRVQLCEFSVCILKRLQHKEENAKMREKKNAKNREKDRRKKILLFVLFIAVIAIAPLISICIFYFSGHTLVVENTTESNVRFLVLWSDGKSSDLITLEANDKINLRKAVWAEGNSEIFVNINGVWSHKRVDDYACPNLNTEAVFKIQSPIQIDIDNEENATKREKEN